MKSTKLFFILFLAGNTFSLARPAPQIEIVEDGRKIGVNVFSPDGGLLHSPEEGLWAVATGWENGWPADWKYSSPEKLLTSGDWTILHGRISLPQGDLLISDSYRARGLHIECRRRWEWTGEEKLDQVTLAVRWMTPGKGKGIVMPGIIYHGNPSGRRSGKTPVYEGVPGEKAFYEEHRFPMPFVSFEYKKGDSWQGAAIHSLPGPVPGGNLIDQWWSMGARATDAGTELCLLSGPTASNGQNSVIKAMQDRFLPYENAWIGISPGEIIEKTFYLQAFPAEKEGAGFQAAVSASLEIFPPSGIESFPSFDEITREKYRFALTRWYENGRIKGFRKYPDRPFLVLGWCGQAASPGYALQVLDKKLNDPRIPQMVQDSLDFLSGAEFYDQGFHTWFNYQENTWLNEEILSQGQAMLNFARAVLAAGRSGINTEKWKVFLEKASTLHSKRILSPEWHPESTNEAFFIAPLCLAAEIFDSPLYLQAAEHAGQVYASRHLSMREPYWGGTLDAQCEDKEGAYAALQGFLELYEATGKEEYLEWSRHAGDVCLTYTVLWDIDFPAGRLRNHNFKTRGWTAVSPQNEHIDVYGVLISPDIYRLGRHTGNQTLKDLAFIMFRSCGQLIDPSGSQGEQPQHTNYTQFRDLEFIEKNGIPSMRGDYNETWTVFWITAHFLNAAARFEDLQAFGPAGLIQNSSFKSQD